MYQVTLNFQRILVCVGGDNSIVWRRKYFGSIKESDLILWHNLKLASAAGQDTYRVFLNDTSFTLLFYTVLLPQN